MGSASTPGGSSHRRHRRVRLQAWASARRTLERVEHSMAGRLARRVTAVRLVDQALILAALAMMLLIPLLITAVAVLPLGSRTGVPVEYGQRLGLTPTALRQVQQLFPAPGTIRGATTPIGALLTIVTAYSWPKALQRGYELVWDLPRLGRRGLWRPLLWVLAFSLGSLALLAAGSLGGGVAWELARWVLGAPLVVGFLWWGQHLLLGARVGWRPLLPGAVVTAAGLYAFRGFTALFFSDAIDSNYRQYGPIGIVFTLLSWLLALSAVMLGGAVVGAVVAERRMGRPRGETSPTDDAEEAPAADPRGRVRGSYFARRPADGADVRAGSLLRRRLRAR